MSHRPERKEMDCLNCGTIVHGKYCHVCGQENTEPKESFWGMVSHFFNDITHFDGKFFTTLRVLLTRPGFLSAEYMRGRRMSYLNPVRMYVFTSALFFLIFFSIRNADEGVKIFDPAGPLTAAQRDSILKKVEPRLERMPGNFNLQKQIELLKDTTRQITTLDLLPYNEEQMFNTIGYKYKNRKEYDSIQKALPASERDGWLQGKWNKRIIYLNEKYKREQQSSFSRFSEVLLHQMPYLLFVSLPFFALILKLLYIRRKQFYYTDHGIFTIHFYIFSFILLLFVFLFDYLSDVTGWGLMNFLMAMTILAWPVYLFIAMKRFYRQNGFKTFVKFCLLSILGVFLASILMLVFFLLSIFQI